MRKDEREVAARVAVEVRRARTAHGWSQLILAEKAGLSLNYVSLIERAELLPTIRVLLQIATPLGLTFGDLVGGAADQKREPAELDPWLSEVLALLVALPLEARPVALGVLRGVAEATMPRVKSGSGVRARKRKM